LGILSYVTSYSAVHIFLTLESIALPYHQDAVASGNSTKLGWSVKPLYTAYLCVKYGSENKQRLFPYTALTGWFI